MKIIKIPLIIVLINIVIIMVISCSMITHEKQEDSRINISGNYANEPLKEIQRGVYEISETVMIENITPEEAQKRAIEKACKRAIEYHSGVIVRGRKINIEAASQNEILIDNFISITEQITRGIITNTEVKSDSIIVKNGNIYKKVEMIIYIGDQTGKRDPTFMINAKLNREYYKEGEEIQLRIKSTKDCYITVINICSNDSVYVLLPNRYNENNFLMNNKEIKIPGEEEKHIGLKYTVSLLPDKEEDIELIKIIATKKDFSFPLIDKPSAYGTYKMALMELQKWLLKIPLSEIAEEDLQYYIYK